jgi:hypothetical protein
MRKWEAEQEAAQREKREVAAQAEFEAEQQYLQTLAHLPGRDADKYRDMQGTLRIHLLLLIYIIASTHRYFCYLRPFGVRQHGVVRTSHHQVTLGCRAIQIIPREPSMWLQGYRGCTSSHRAWHQQRRGTRGEANRRAIPKVPPLMPVITTALGPQSVSKEPQGGPMSGVEGRITRECEKGATVRLTLDPRFGYNRST